MGSSEEGVKYICDALDNPGLMSAILQYGLKTFKIKSNQLKLLTSIFVQEYFQRQQSRMVSEGNGPSSASLGKREENWQPNELKVFAWVLISYSYSRQKIIELFDSYDQAYLYSLFPWKSEDFIHYNIRALSLQEKKSGRDWKEQEVDLLLDIINSDEFGKRWSDIAFILYLRSDRKFFKTSHQCREKWFNHLNPSLKKEKWTLEEDVALFRLAKELDTKWARISREMGEYRTEHMVKNRFKSIFKRYQSSTRKRIENILKDLENKLQNQAEQGAKEEESGSYNVKEEGDMATPTIPEEVPRETRQRFHKLNEQVQVINFEFVEDRFHLAQINGCIVNIKEEGSVLIDYTNMDFEVINKTIFSGSVE